jgi:hypothetical protein
MVRKFRRAALYLRVSTDDQTVENQRLALEATCDQRSWEVVQIYTDNGISGSRDAARLSCARDGNLPRRAPHVAPSGCRFGRSQLRHA